MSLDPTFYTQTLDQLKSEIRTARVKATLAVNAKLLQLYWKVGSIIQGQQQAQGWGAKVIETLSRDIGKEFPDLKGFSPRNILYMRRFSARYSDLTITQPPAAQLPWAHHVVLLDKVKEDKEQQFYMYKTLENGWSRDVLSLQIKSNVYQRQGSSLTNFEFKLPAPQSDLAQQALKDPHIFDFLSLTEKYHEKELEAGLVEHITKFLLELGAGFAFVGRQYHLEVDNQDFYMDLLFYHLKLRCYIVIELKKGKFLPEYAGKLNFYMPVVDDKLRTEHDQPSIGLLICQDKNKVVAEYALKDANKPIGVYEYQLIEAIPENLKSSLPSIEDLERELKEP